MPGAKKFESFSYLVPLSRQIKSLNDVTVLGTHFMSMQTHSQASCWLQHSLVGSVERRGISGGQRKRVNIGVELVAKPSLLFMDEPTSGLDATAATDILSALRR